MTAKALFNRDFSLNVGGKKISTNGEETLRISFNVTKTLGKEPNKAEISIENLREETRALFQKKNEEIELEAGYVENTSLIFKGTVTTTNIERLPTGWVVSVECSDGGTQIRRARTNKSTRGKVSIKNVARGLVNDIGVGQGNIADLPDLDFTNGFVSSGRADQQLEKVARKAKVRYSIQDGQAVFLEREQTRRGTVVLLSTDSGLVGSPQLGEKGFVTATAKIQPYLSPGYAFRLESRLINGFFRIERSVYRGDSWGDEWVVELEGSPL